MLEVGAADSWEEDANTRIEEIRKRDVQIKILDSNNNPIPDATVEVHQLKHDFAFGSALTRHAMYDSRYTDYFKQRFEWAAFENESKWYHNENSRGNVTYADADYMYEWCKENDILVRGHCVFGSPRSGNLLAYRP